MISVHSVKSLLEAKRSKTSPGNKGSAQRKLNSEVKTTMITILAIGTSDQTRIPESFHYSDPLNCWRSKTKFVKSPVLKGAIQKSWKKFEERSNPKRGNVPTSLAKHVVLNADLVEIELVAGGGDYERNVKLRKADGLLEFMSHAPSENALDRCLEKKLLQVKDVPAQEECQTIAEITDQFSDESKLPTSCKYDTAKFKHRILPIPHQLGLEGTTNVGDLYLSRHNAAHMKFTELTRPHVEYTDVQIQHKLESLLQSHSST